MSLNHGCGTPPRGKACRIRTAILHLVKEATEVKEGRVDEEGWKVHDEIHDG